MMPLFWSILFLAYLLGVAFAQFFPETPLDDKSPYTKDNDERFNQILMKTQALEEEFGRLRETVEYIGDRVDKLYYGATQWQQWSSYTPCSQTCVPADGSTGTQTRTRSCNFTVPPLIHSEAVCGSGEREETRNCSAVKPCSAVAGQANPSDYAGGDGGRAFSDESVWNGENITAVRLNCDNLVNSIQVKYGNNWGSQHGIDFDSCDVDGSFYTYTLDSTEYINSVLFWNGNLIDSITITTNKRTLPTCGGYGGTKKIIDGTRLLYISGRSGCVIDGIQLHWAIE